MRRAVGVMVLVALMAGLSPAPAAGHGRSTEDSRTERLSTAVNEPVELAVTPGSRVRGAVWVEVAVRDVGDRSLRRDAAAAHLESAPGSGDFRKLPLRESRPGWWHSWWPWWRDSATELVGRTRLPAGSGEIRLHLWQ